MKVPQKYLSKNPDVMKREIKKHAEKKDSDSSAYKEWDADYKSKKAGKGKPVKTNVSKYTKKYKEMYGESESESQLKTIMDYDSFSSNLSEGKRKYSVSTPGSPSDKALKKKSEIAAPELAINLPKRGTTEFILLIVDFPPSSGPGTVSALSLSYWYSIFASTFLSHLLRLVLPL